MTDDATTAGPATVVVSRRVRPGQEAEFARWQRQILREVERAPGYVAATAEPPSREHPDEWVVVYRFRTTDDLDGWLDSPVRRELVATAAELTEGEPREQLIVTPSADPVTLVSSIRLRLGTEAEHRVLHSRAVNAARRIGGFVSTELREPVPGAQRDTVALLTFESREALDRWLDSDERQEILTAVDALAEGDRTINVVGGFVGWFGAEGGNTPPRWKQATVVLAALLPFVFITPAVTDALWPELPSAAATAVGAAVNVGLLTWLVVPALTRLLRRWLSD